jgi:hypothetical protein
VIYNLAERISQTEADVIRSTEADSYSSHHYNNNDNLCSNNPPAPRTRSLSRTQSLNDLNFQLNLRERSAINVINGINSAFHAISLRLFLTEIFHYDLRQCNQWNSNRHNDNEMLRQLALIMKIEIIICEWDESNRLLSTSEIFNHVAASVSIPSHPISLDPNCPKYDSTSLIAAKLTNSVELLYIPSERHYQLLVPSEEGKEYYPYSSKGVLSDRDIQRTAQMNSPRRSSNSNKNKNIVNTDNNNNSTSNRRSGPKVNNNNANNPATELNSDAELDEAINLNQLTQSSSLNRMRTNHNMDSILARDHISPILIANHDPVYPEIKRHARFNYVAHSTNYMNVLLNAVNDSDNNGRGNTELIIKCLSQLLTVHVDVCRKSFKHSNSGARTGNRNISNNRNHNENQPDDNDNNERDVRTILGAIAKLKLNGIGRSIKYLAQNTKILDIHCKPDLIEQLRQLHPQIDESSQLPSVPSHVVEPTIDPDKLTKTLKRMCTGAAAGPSGLTMEHMRVLIETELGMELLAGVCTLIASGKLPEEAKSLLLSSRLIALEKPDGGIRPIAIGETLYRLTAAHLINELKDNIAEVLQPVQLGVGVKGGCEIVIHNIRKLLLDPRKKFAAITIDFKNAFNSVSRLAMFAELYKHESLAPLYRLAHWAYSGSSDLYIRDESGSMNPLIQSRTGCRQGDPLGGLLFALAVKPIFESVLKSHPEVRGAAILDDFTIVGPPEFIIEVYQKLEDVAGTINLEIQHRKCQFIYFHSFAEKLSDKVNEFATLKGIPIADKAFLLLGSVIGVDRDIIQQLLTSKVENTINDTLFRLLNHPKMPVQLAMIFLAKSAIQRLQYLARTMPPSEMRAIAKLFDDRVLDTALNKLKLNQISPKHKQKAIEWIRLPTKFGGMGLTQTLNILHYAWLASIHNAGNHKGNHLLAFTDRLDPNSDLFQQFIESLKHAKINSFPLADEESNENNQLNNEFASPNSFAVLPMDEDEINDIEMTMERKNDPPCDQPQPNSISRRKSKAIYRKKKRRAAPTILPLNPDDFMTMPFATECEMQHKLTQQDYTQKHNERLTIASSNDCKAEIILMHSIAAPGTNWPQIIPCYPSLILYDMEYCACIRMRYRLPINDSILADDPQPNSIARCPYCISGDYAVDPYHGLSCTRVPGGAKIDRHNAVAHCVAYWCRAAGAPVQREPTLYYRGNLRPDLVISLNYGKLLVDVTIVHPTSAGRVLAQTGADRPLVAADKVKQAKEAKYNYHKRTEAAQNDNIEFIACAIDTYGGIHPDAESLFNRIALNALDHSSIYSATTIINRLKADVAIAVQRGNAIAIFKGGEPNKIIANKDRSQGSSSTLVRNIKAPNKQRSQPANQNLYQRNINHNNNSNDIPIVSRNPFPSSSSVNQQTQQQTDQSHADSVSSSLSVRAEANQLLDSVGTSILMHSAHVNYGLMWRG